MPTSQNKIKITAGLVLLAAAASAGVYLQNRGSDSGENDTGFSAANQGSTSSAGNDSAGQSLRGNPQNTNGAGQTGDGSGNENDETRQKIENGQLTDETVFSRANFFKPVNWGTDHQALGALEAQRLSFKPSCAKHPRAQASADHPAGWAEPFTHTDSLSRWPSSSAHVIDWNQFWKVGEKGIQISIRWNFELPARYAVVGYSFPLQNPDGYGTSIFPENPEFSWEDAKAFVTAWEKKTLAEGGLPATRSMSLADRPFNPAEVSTEEVERAEFSNSRIRAAQTGKMICNSPSPALTELSCSCTF